LDRIATAWGPEEPPFEHPDFSIAGGCSYSPQTAKAFRLFTRRMETLVPMRIGVFEDGRILGTGFVILSRDAIVRESLFKERDPCKALLLSSRATVRHRGPVFVAGNSRGAGFYHWMAQVMPAIVHSERLRISFAYAVPVLGSWMRRSFELVADAAREVVEIPRDRTLRADRIAYATTLSASNIVPLALRNRVAEILKSKLGLVGSIPYRKLYISRADVRRRPLLNGAELDRFFAEAGFEVITPGTLPLDDQVRLFHEAALVVGPHGGGLTNVMFCQPGAVVYELLQSDYGNPCMATLARANGTRYVFDFFPSTDGLGKKTAGWAIDLSTVEKTLRLTETEWKGGPRGKPHNDDPSANLRNPAIFTSLP
jgi:hypothetical protein